MTEEKKESDCYGGVEELFAACRFEEASRRAADLLLQEEKMESKEDSMTNGDAASTQLTVEIDSSCSVLLDDSCTQADKVAAILLQCGHELKRQDEEAAFCRYYAHRRPMPFPVALIWLQLWLARGDFRAARPVLESLLRNLQQALSRDGACHEALKEMHAEVAGMLVKRTLVPLGEYEAAKELVATDPHLQDDHRKHLLGYCQAEERSAKGPLPRGTADWRGASSRSATPVSEARPGGAECSVLTTRRSSSASYLASCLINAPAAMRDCFYPIREPTTGGAPGQQQSTAVRRRGELRRLVMGLLGVGVLLIGFHWKRGVRERGRQTAQLLRRTLTSLAAFFLGIDSL